MTTAQSADDVYHSSSLISMGKMIKVTTVKKFQLEKTVHIAKT